MVAVSQGTVDNSDPGKLIVSTLEALKDGPYVVVATTAGTRTEQLRERFAAPNVVIEDFINYDDLFPHVDVFVTNGGFGSVLAAMRHGVPVVAAGKREGKNDINARVGWNRLGVDLRSERPRPASIRAAVRRVLDDPTYASQRGEAAGRARLVRPHGPHRSRTPAVVGDAMTVNVALRIAAVLLWLNGVGFGVFTLPAMLNLLRGQEVPIVMGFKAYGGGPFERHGLNTTVWLLAAFLLVCVVECAAGWLLWGGHRSGAVLALAVLPFAGIFWWGFALPFGPVIRNPRNCLDPAQLAQPPLADRGSGRRVGAALSGPGPWETNWIIDRLPRGRRPGPGRRPRWSTLLWRRLDEDFLGVERAEVVLAQ